MFKLLPSTVKTLIIKTPGYVRETPDDGVMVGSVEDAFRHPDRDVEGSARIFKRWMYRLAAHWGIDFHARGSWYMFWIIWCKSSS